jgi:hypothetical protein
MVLLYIAPTRSEYKRFFRSQLSVSASQGITCTAWTDICIYFVMTYKSCQCRRTTTQAIQCFFENGAPWFRRTLFRGKIGPGQHSLETLGSAAFSGRGDCGGIAGQRLVYRSQSKVIWSHGWRLQGRQWNIGGGRGGGERLAAAVVQWLWQWCMAEAAKQWLWQWCMAEAAKQWL